MRLLAFPTLPIHLLVTCYLDDFVQSGGIIMWGLAFPVATELIFFGPRWTFVWFGILAADLLLSFWLPPLFGAVNVMPPVVIAIVFTRNFLPLNLVMMGVMAYFLSLRDHACRWLRGEQVKAENLLLNVLPSESAAILKDDQRTAPSPTTMPKPAFYLRIW
jgi:hypothetical protein